MEAASAVLQLISLIQRRAEDAKHNVDLCVALSARCMRLQRILNQHPDNLERLDPELVGRLFEFLSRASELIKDYGVRSSVGRLLRAGSVKKQFQHIEKELQECLDDVALAMGAQTMHALSNVQFMLSPKAAPQEEKAESEPETPDWHVNYLELEFETRRGVRKEIGSGGFGRVFAATYHGVKVAVKEPIDVNALTPAAIDEFRDELNLAYSMRHKNIVSVYGGGVGYMDDETSPPEYVKHPFMVMEYMTNKSLAYLLFTEKTQLSLEQVIKLSHGVLSALMYLHAHKPSIIHRDLKPENILLDEHMCPKLIDFGLAKVKLESMRVSTAIRGSVEWMAPEQLAGDCTPKIDLYAFGLCFYAMATNERPFDPTMNPFQMTTVLREGLAKYSLPASFPEGFDRLLAQCLARSPHDRPTAHQALQQFIKLAKQQAIRLYDDDDDVIEVPETKAPEDDDDDGFGFGAFEELQEQAQNLTSARRIFRHNDQFVSLFGKRVVLDLTHFGSKSEFEESDAPLEGDMPPQVSSTPGTGHGTVIFHIDTTGSMSLHDRMKMVGRVLVRVIPDMLRRGMTIILNGWSSLNGGKVRTKEITVDNPELLLADNSEELKEYLRNILRETLTLGGRTDLYGSCYQLFEQCAQITGPVWAFVLTDGEQNDLLAPLHRSSGVHDDYFGVFKGNDQGGWVATNQKVDDFEAMSVLGTRFAPLTHCICVLVGIGDAKTKFLSALSDALKPRSKFYGITEVATADTVFDPALFVVEEPTKLVFGDHKCEVKVSNTRIRSDGHWVGTCEIPDNMLSSAHSAGSVLIVRGDVSLAMALDTAEQPEAPSFQNQVNFLNSIASVAYECTPQNLHNIFRKLVDDRAKIAQAKRNFFSRERRRYRNSTQYLALEIWIEDIEQLVESQITAYRQNFQEDVLKGFEEGVAPDAAQEISSTAVERLRNNLKQAGMESHRVERLLVTVQALRDRTLAVATKLLSRDVYFVLDGLPTGAAVTISLREGDTELSTWPMSITAFEMGVRPLFEIASTDESTLPSAVSDFRNYRVDTFPAVLVRAGFDPTTIVHGAHLFTAFRLPLNASGTPHLVCVQELWDACRINQWTVGKPFPIAQMNPSLEAGDANMVVVLAHTPTLFQAFVEQSRVYASALNITGNLLALANVSLQWPKVFNDMLWLAGNQGGERPIQHVSLLLALQSLASYALAVNSTRVPPSMESLVDMFASAGPVISRDDNPGHTCFKSMTALLVVKELGANVQNWNVYVRSCFARLCEAISGHHRLRFDPKSGRADPQSLELEYRMVLGDLQGVIGKRLHLEWPKLSQEEKLACVATKANDIVEVIQRIINEYLAKLGELGTLGWGSFMQLLGFLLKIHNHGIDRLLADFESTGYALDLIYALQEVQPPAQLMYPVVKSSGDALIVCDFAEQVDPVLLVDMIDALVLTKADPKARRATPIVASFPRMRTGEANIKVITTQEDFNMDLPHMTIAFMGEINSGKSTTAGQMLLSLGLVHPDIVPALMTQASSIGRADRYLSWISDSSALSRERAMTIERNYHTFQTNSIRFTLVDNPGHKDFTKHAATGIHQADVAILILSAVPSESETAFAVDSQTRDHAALAYCFGVRHVVVAINKLDCASESKEATDTAVYPQDLFDNLQERIQALLQKCGFKPKQISCIPTSAVHADNVMESSARTPWYTGPTLIETLDSLPLPVREVDLPLRIPIEEVIGNGRIFCGRVESGKVAVGDRLVIAPLGQEITVSSIQSHRRDLNEAKAGENVGLMVLGASRKDARSGMVLGSKKSPPSTVRQFQARVMVAKTKRPFRVNYCPSLFIHNMVVQAKIVALNQRLDKRTGAVVEENPSELASGDAGIVTFEVIRPVSIESFSLYPRLGRFCIQENRKTVALGMVTSIVM